MARFLVGREICGTVDGEFRAPVMRILDKQGKGIPNIRVVSDNGIVCHTRVFLDG